MKIDTKVSGTVVHPEDREGVPENVGRIVIGVAPDRVTSVDAGDHDVEVRRYQPGGREDLDEAEVSVKGLADGEVISISIEVADATPEGATVADVTTFGDDAVIEEADNG